MDLDFIFFKCGELALTDLDFSFIFQVGLGLGFSLDAANLKRLDLEYILWDRSYFGQILLSAGKTIFNVRVTNHVIAELRITAQLVHNMDFLFVIQIVANNNTYILSI